MAKPTSRHTSRRDLQITPTCVRCVRCGGAVPTFEALGFTVAAEACANCAPALAVEWEAQDRAKATDRLMRDAGSTNRLATWTLRTYPDDDEARRLLGEARSWYSAHQAGERTNLLLFGGIGAGKTGLAWGLIRQLVEDEIDLFYATPADERTRTEPQLAGTLVVWRDMLGEMRRMIGEPDAGALVERARTVPVLALDDVGAERPTDWARDELAQLVEERYQHRRPTIVTSNYDPAELARRLGHDDLVIGQRIISRLCERAVQVRFSGADRRLIA